MFVKLSGGMLMLMDQQATTANQGFQHIVSWQSVSCHVHAGLLSSSVTSPNLALIG